MNYGLLWGMVACDFRPLGFAGELKQEAHGVPAGISDKAGSRGA